jgi:Uma2 family endonuclease
MHGMPWSSYEVMLALRGDAPRPRLSYRGGELELTSPSVDHELITSILDRLVQVAAQELDVDLWPVRSWTVRNAAKERGVEPDACYTLGNPRLKDAPDLAIEVVWTSGGIDKLDIYRALGVAEVWFWRDDALTAYVLRDGQYQPVEHSALLLRIDLALLARLARKDPRSAERALRESLGAPISR